MAQIEEELNTTTFDIYLYLVKVHEPTGPREIMRAMDIKSPGVAHRHLQKLANWGWVDKDEYGRYFIEKKVGFHGYIWVGKQLINISILYALSFVILTTSLIAILVIHLWFGSPIDASYAVLIGVTVVAMAFLLAEALHPRKHVPKQPIGG